MDTMFHRSQVLVHSCHGNNVTEKQYHAVIQKTIAGSNLGFPRLLWSPNSPWPREAFRDTSGRQGLWPAPLPGWTSQPLGSPFSPSGFSHTLVILSVLSPDSMPPHSLSLCTLPDSPPHLQVGPWLEKVGNIRD